MNPQVLANRDTNIQSPKMTSPTVANDKPAPKTMEFHRQILESRMKSGELVTPGISALVPSEKQPLLKQLHIHNASADDLSGRAQEQPTYISPSDQIQSPATKKLEAFKSKQITKAKPKTLFAKTQAKNLQAAKAASMFPDINQNNNTNSGSMDKS